MLVWYLEGATRETKYLDFYPTVKEIFEELSRKSNTKLEIPPLAKRVDQPMVEPLTDVEKEEDYEVWIHLNTFMLYPD